ncbi:acyl carrier protein [Streptomyces sp. MA5143a]|uniref:acyl carrier protein n=1 Tax=Streptomyces sp. MA5143a TaxID=2083010 RepID=UPI000D19ECD1|nr:acyl carrier protein [Streptomyces sp. MA5143a]SPF07422.1 Acyl carrier protein [Streptomyces sp. MA5143a]
MSTIDERVKKIIIRELGVEEEINNRTLLDGHLVTDEVASVKLFVALEDEFEISLPEFAEFATVQDGINHITWQCR